MNSVTMMERWYGMNCVLWEMLYAFMFDRECAMMIPTYLQDGGDGRKMFRCLNVFKAEGIVFALNKMVGYKELGKPVNVYATLAKYSKLPVMSPVMQFRVGKEKEFRENHHKDMVSYDFFVDVDAATPGDMKFAKLGAHNIMKVFDMFCIPFYLRFSGKGYHFIVPHYVFKKYSKSFDPHLEDGENIYGFYNRVLDALSVRCAGLVDTGIHDSRRVAKVPYSLVHYRDGTFVCWPFNTRQEFQNRTRDDFKMSSSMTFRGEERIFRRGQTLFNANEWTVGHTDKFLEHLGVGVDVDE